MTQNAFWPADILIPTGIDLPLWSVVACDQFSSEPDYWARVDAAVGNSPSTLRLIVPEAYLDRVDTLKSADTIAERMADYQKCGIFRKLYNSLIYVERTVSDGSVRCGLVGMLDLDAYDYTPGAKTPVRASERTIVSRLPARIDVRRRAPLELPHIMALINDRDRRIIEPLSNLKEQLEQVYDFELMEGGGAIRGWRLGGDAANTTVAALTALASGDGAQIIIGDGNHSLAAAKGYWNEIKTSLSDAERSLHPARFALVELNNVYDPAVRFEPIHRVLFRTDPAELLSALELALPSGKDGYLLGYASAAGTGAFTAAAGSIGDFIEKLQSFLDDYVSRTGCGIDYVHGDAAAEGLGRGAGCLALLMPTMDKSEFFRTVENGGLFPKKSFSIGHAQDKRYYLEARAIR